ncbi:MAG: hypothetical protein GX900_08430 [Clostridiaceae bacterium]|nr:hypothetical protein [Clostridiaceae bacterium]
MSVVTMERFRLVGLLSERREIIDRLAALGAVEVRADAELQAELSRELAERIGNGAANSVDAEERAASVRRELDALNREADQLEELLPVCQRLNETKKGLFPRRPKVNLAAFESVLDRRDDLLSQAQHLRDLLRDQEQLEREIVALHLEQQQNAIWVDLNPELQHYQSERLRIVTGSFANPKTFVAARTMLDEHESAAHLLPLDYDTAERPATRAALVATPEDMTVALQAVRQIGFVRSPELPGRFTYADELTALRERENRLATALEEIKKESKLIALMERAFALLADALRHEAERLAAEADTLTGERAFMLRGYVPAHLYERIKDELTAEFTVAVENAPADDAEDAPTWIYNRPLLQPYAEVTRMFSMPHAAEVDPTPAMGVCYALIFGMMYSDVGYGALLALGCALLLYRFKVRGTLRAMCQMFMQCGIVSMFFGLCFGGFFGNFISVLSGETVHFPTLLFDPLGEPISMVIFSVAAGMLHIVVGLALKVYNLWSIGDIAGAICDPLAWIFILAGGALYLLGGWVSTAGLVLLATGALILLLFSNRDTYNPIKRLMSGLGALYGAINYFSDLISYTRILALTLSTSVIAMVVNILGTMMGLTIPGVIVFLVVMPFGHLLNVALSVLSAYVHTARLQYVEFFGKFFTGGGRAWMPLALRPRHVDIEDAPQNELKELKPVVEPLRTRYARFTKYIENN